MNAADERGHDGLTSEERIKEMLRPILLDWGHECTAALRAALSAAEERERKLRTALHEARDFIAVVEVEEGLTIDNLIEMIDSALKDGNEALEAR